MHVSGWIPVIEKLLIVVNWQPLACYGWKWWYYGIDTAFTRKRSRGSISIYFTFHNLIDNTGIYAWVWLSMPFLNFQLWVSMYNTIIFLLYGENYFVVVVLRNHIKHLKLYRAMQCYNVGSLLSVWNWVLNCCCVCYDPEIEVNVMSTDTTSGTTGFTLPPETLRSAN